MPDLIDALKISAAGMKVQGARVLVISQNLANQDSTPKLPGEDPYRRKVISFKQVLDRKTGLQMVDIDRVRPDESDFGQRYDPGHPAADKNGFVKTPNVNTLIEAADMRGAQRSYEFNLAAIETSRDMINRTIDLLRN
ncbi:MAG: flagellar basal body rod protein FlgC [Alphaproteobacteria bacterium]|nr:flagellar basal body rod protein FlgC [Alphaproteobacteria bacterium]